MQELDDRFSYSEFMRLGRNSPEARERCDELNAAVEALIYARLPEIMTGIIEELNKLGHGLKTHTSDDASLWFADVRDEDELRRWWLRLSIDVVVSSGFPHFEDEPGQS